MLIRFLLVLSVVVPAIFNIGGRSVKDPGQILGGSGGSCYADDAANCPARQLPGCPGGDCIGDPAKCDGPQKTDWSGPAYAWPKSASAGFNGTTPLGSQVPCYAEKACLCVQKPFGQEGKYCATSGDVTNVIYKQPTVAAGDICIFASLSDHKRFNMIAALNGLL